MLIRLSPSLSRYKVTLDRDDDVSDTFKNVNKPPLTKMIIPLLSLPPLLTHSPRWVVIKRNSFFFFHL